MPLRIAADPVRLRDVEQRHQDDVIRLRQAMRTVEYRYFEFMSAGPDFVAGLPDPISDLETVLGRISLTDREATTYADAFLATQQVLNMGWPLAALDPRLPRLAAGDDIVRIERHRISGKAMTFLGLHGAIELETQTMASGESRIIYHRSAGPDVEIGIGSDIEIDVSGAEWADDVAKASASVGASFTGEHERIWTVAAHENLDEAIVAVALQTAGVSSLLNTLEANIGWFRDQPKRVFGFDGNNRPVAAAVGPEELESRHTLTIESEAAAKVGASSLAGVLTTIASDQGLPSPELAVLATEHVSFEHRENHPHVVEVGLTIAGDTGLADAVAGVPSSGAVAAVVRVPDLADPRRIEVELSHLTGRGDDESERTVSLDFDLDEPEAAEAAIDLLATAGVLQSGLGLQALAVPAAHLNRERIRTSVALVAGRAQVRGVDRRAETATTSSRTRKISASFGMGPEFNVEANIETETTEIAHDR